MTAFLATSTSFYAALKRYQFKKDCPVHERHLLIRVDFGLWGLWYVIRDGRGLATTNPDCPFMAFHTAHLIGVGPVIGPRDLEAASHRTWAQGWRESMHARIQERIALA